jgi:uncharacterized protein
MENGKKKRGFAVMDRALVSEIAKKGGKAAHAAGTAHEFSSEEARTAGAKGGRATHAKLRELKAKAQASASTERLIFNDDRGPDGGGGLDGMGR